MTNDETLKAGDHVEFPRSGRMWPGRVVRTYLGRPNSYGGCAPMVLISYTRANGTAGLKRKSARFVRRAAKEG